MSLRNHVRTSVLSPFIVTFVGSGPKMCGTQSLFTHPVLTGSRANRRLVRGRLQIRWPAAVALRLQACGAGSAIGSRSFTICLAPSASTIARLARPTLPSST